MFLKSMLVVSLTLLFDLCKFLYSSILVSHGSNFLGFFLFDVLCRCNLSGFYITFIVSMSFFFSFLSFVAYSILFIMSATMEKVCNGGFTYLVLEVLKNILHVASNPPTPPKQLLHLILYGSFLIGLPTPIITTNLMMIFCGLMTKVRFIYAMCSLRA